MTTVLSSCYLAGQGYHLAAQQIAARPVDRIPADDLSAGEQELLQRVATIRTFAETRLGLAAGDGYTTYYRSDRDHLVDVVSAAREFSFVRKEWWFPVVGRVPYKGFYRPEPARRLARRLDRRGWDVIVRPVEAFSTLGYLRDPLVSYMQSYSDARLAELIIHEMAHATIWVPGHASFNEEFATYVGRAGAVLYLEDRYGADSPEVHSVRDDRADVERFRRDVLALRDELAALYARRAGAPVETLRREKADTIGAFQERFAAHYDDHYRTDRYRFFADTRVNNAYLDLFQTYSGRQERFAAFSRTAAGGDLRGTVAELQRRVNRWRALPRRRRGDPFDLLGPRLPSGR